MADGAITSTQIRCFTEFGNRGYYCVLLNDRNIAVVDGEVVKVSEVLEF